MFFQFIFFGFEGDEHELSCGVIEVWWSGEPEAFHIVRSLDDVLNVCFKLHCRSFLAQI